MVATRVEVSEYCILMVLMSENWRCKYEVRNLDFLQLVINETVLDSYVS